MEEMLRFIRAISISRFVMGRFTQFGDARRLLMRLLCSLAEKHNHPPDVAANQVVATIGKMKKRAIKNQQFYRYTYNEALQDLSKCGSRERAAANMPTLSSSDCTWISGH